MNKGGRPKERIDLTESERIKLDSILASGSKRMARRAETILLSASGMDSTEIPGQVGLSKASVCKWRKRYLASGVEGLSDAPRTGRTRDEFHIRDGEHDELVAWSKSRSLPKSIVSRATIVLLTAEGKSNNEIEAVVGLGNSTVRRWQKRYQTDGIEGLHDEYRKGHTRTYDEEDVAGLLKKTLESKPEGSTHWSSRTMAKESGISASTVSRIWKMFELKPHRRKGFKLSTDPFFVEKVVDVCGLYLNPPDHAIVLCVDEKSQCQALERTQPILPMGLGYAEGATDNYFRHGVMTLFSAFNVANGEVQIACKKRHRHQEFIAFLNQVKKNVPNHLDVHLIMDNYSTHKHDKVKAWLARNPRFSFHFTPTYSSWLNQVERWFAIITDKAIRRGSFTSVKDLITKVEKFTEVYNRSPQPFRWTATAEEILAKVGRLCEKLTDVNY